MKKSHFTIIISVITASLLHANDSDQDMESLLNNVSTIATKKSINVDYMPSVVTVIDAETFLDAGRAFCKSPTSFSNLRFLEV